MKVSTSTLVFPLAWILLQKRSADTGIYPSITTDPPLLPQVIRECIRELNSQASRQVLPDHLSSELRALLIFNTHRIEKTRDIASKYLNRLITSFPSLMFDPSLVFAILEVLTLLRQACENEFTDEVRINLGSSMLVNSQLFYQYNPIYEFHSEKTGITLQLSDDYKTRNEILGQLYRNANNWFELALGRAPIELQTMLQVGIRCPQ